MFTRVSRSLLTLSRPSLRSISLSLPSTSLASSLSLRSFSTEASKPPPKRFYPTDPRNFTLRELADAGFHYGLPHNLTNHKVNSHLLGSRNGVEIFNLQHVRLQLMNVYAVLQGFARSGHQILFTTSSSKYWDTITKAAIQSKQLYIADKWKPGRLTGSIGDSFRPVAIFCPDLKNNSKLVREANLVSIPVIGIINTDSRVADMVSYPIFANHESHELVEFYCQFAANALCSGMRPGEVTPEMKQELERIVTHVSRIYPADQRGDQELDPEVEEEAEELFVRNESEELIKERFEDATDTARMQWAQQIAAVKARIAELPVRMQQFRADAKKDGFKGTAIEVEAQRRFNRVSAELRSELSKLGNGPTIWGTMLQSAKFPVWFAEEPLSPKQLAQKNHEDDVENLFSHEEEVQEQLEAIGEEAPMFSTDREIQCDLEEANEEDEEAMALREAMLGRVNKENAELAMRAARNGLSDLDRLYDTPYSQLLDPTEDIDEFLDENGAGKNSELDAEKRNLDDEDEDAEDDASFESDLANRALDRIVRNMSQRDNDMYTSREAMLKMMIEESESELAVEEADHVTHPKLQNAHSMASEEEFIRRMVKAEYPLPEDFYKMSKREQEEWYTAANQLYQKFEEAGAFKELQQEMDECERIERAELEMAAEDPDLDEEDREAAVAELAVEELFSEYEKTHGLPSGTVASMKLANEVNVEAIDNEMTQSSELAKLEEDLIAEDFGRDSERMHRLDAAAQDELLTPEQIQAALEGEMKELFEEPEEEFFDEMQKVSEEQLLKEPNYRLDTDGRADFENPYLSEEGDFKDDVENVRQVVEWRDEMEEEMEQDAAAEDDLDEDLDNKYLLVEDESDEQRVERKEMYRTEEREREKEAAEILPEREGAAETYQGPGIHRDEWRNRK